MNDINNQTTEQRLAFIVAMVILVAAAVLVVMIALWIGALMAHIAAILLAGLLGL